MAKDSIVSGGLDINKHINLHDNISLININYVE